MKQKKIPMRTCTGCGEQKPKKELVRVVRSPEGEISLIPQVKSPEEGLIFARTPPALPKPKRQSV